MSLARTVDLRADDLKGKTWAGYIRESTRGQADRYGPEIQRAEQANVRRAPRAAPDPARVRRSRVGQGHAPADRLRTDARGR